MSFFNIISLSCAAGLWRGRSFSIGRSDGRITIKGRKSGKAVVCDIDPSDVTNDKPSTTILSQLVSLVKRKAKAFVGVLNSEVGFWQTKIAHHGAKIGEYIANSCSALPPRKGYSMPVGYVPVGFKIFNVAGYARACGTYAQVLRKRAGSVLVRLPSLRFKWLPAASQCTVGQVSNPRAMFSRFRSAGDRIRRGYRSTVRGTAMNPVDHPHGGGQGKTSGGRSSISQSGILAKGYKTVRTVFKRLKEKKAAFSGSARRTS